MSRAATSGVCPLSTSRTTYSRPKRVNRGFSWMFIRTSWKDTVLLQEQFLRPIRIDGLLKGHSSGIDTPAKTVDPLLISMNHYSSF
jgi:hypothetical protein